MKKNATELVFILDNSGSMSGLESDTVGGFNSMLKKQKKEDGECFVTTVLFNSKTHMVHDRENITNIQNMTEDDYVVGGCTALIDAIGETIDYISVIQKHLRPEDVPDHTIFVITTDGYENASHKFNIKEVKKKIEKKKKAGWEFIFVGANIDAVSTAHGFGISAERAVNYNADSTGTDLLFDCVSEAACAIRNDVALQADWGKRLDEDYQRRGHKK